VKLEFGTKAETLARLAPQLQRSYVLPLESFDYETWRGEQAACLDRAAKLEYAGSKLLVVRSSAQREDGSESSCAGAFESILGVAREDPGALAEAIESVFASYGEPAGEDQVLLQPQLSEVRLAGVLFSRDLSTLGPYRIFNYDDSGSTTSVTSGEDARLETYLRVRGCQEPFPSPDLERAFAALEEVESLLGDRLEIELAVDAAGEVCLFQARPMTVPAQDPQIDEAALDWLEKVRKKIEKLSRPHPQLCGTRSVFGVMPDWNPAEIIGVKPRALSLSLYKELVTDSVWAYMRHNYGYRNLRSFPLLVSFLGVPYIDVRVSFNSFVPRRLRESLAEKLVNHYVERLIAQPQAHDKVEFDIVFSCYYPGVREAVGSLAEHGFSGEEIGELLAELRHLTNQIVHPARGLYLQDLERIETLRARHREVVESDMSSVDKIYWLIENTKRYGTLPFSGLARAGFVAVQFLRGLVKTEILTTDELQSCLESLDTVTNRLGRDVGRLGRGELSREEFLDDYGHLRPGTYDILSPRYDEAFDRYFGAASREETAARPSFELRPEQLRAVDAFLSKEGFELTAAEFMAFIKAGIEGREYAKLVFTRSLSAALVELEHLGRRCELSSDDLSHLDVRSVLSLYSSLDGEDLREILLREIEANRRAYRLTQLVRLPDLIVSPDDVLHFHLDPSEPNFVTLGRVSAEVIRVEDLADQDPSGKIVCAPAADPGYDWLFTRQIAGLVTQFGGANSHMAIRAAELGLPAVIGCGERNYQTWSGASRLELDCAARTVRVLR
jgi:glutamine kinase